MKLCTCIEILITWIMLSCFQFAITFTVLQLGWPSDLMENWRIAIVMSPIYGVATTWMANRKHDRL